MTILKQWTPGRSRRAQAVAAMMLAALIPQSVNAIINGNPTDQYGFVGLISGTGRFGSFEGTGQLIAPDWVLTAGHVVEGMTSADFAINGVHVQAQSSALDPLYNPRNILTRGHDFGLIHLAAPVDGVTLPTLYDGSLGGVPGGGFPVTLVGFGAIDGLGTASGVLRAGSAQVDVSSALFLQTDFSGAGMAATGPGDSGGALMASLGQGELLAGIHSFGTCASRFDCASVAGVVSSGRAFIDGFASGVHWGVAAPSAVPEPGTATLLLLGLAVGACITRRAR